MTDPLAIVRRFRADLWPLLPAGPQVALLQACLGPSEQVHRAWAKWTAGVGSPRRAILRDLWSIKNLLPLLHDSLRNAGVRLDERLQTVLRTAAFRERLRARTIRRLVGGAVSVLAEAGLPFTIVGEYATAHAAYDDAAVRHTGLVRLVAVGDALDRVAEILASVSWCVLARGGEGDDSWAALKHASGLEMRLAGRWTEWPILDMSPTELRSRSVELPLHGPAARQPCVADLLSATLAEPCCRGSWRHIEWFCDAAMLIHRMRPPDWEAFVGTTGRAPVAAPVAVLLECVSGAAGRPLPTEALYRLAGAAAEDPDETRRLMALCVRSAVRASPLAALRKAPNLRGWALAAKECLCAMPVTLAMRRWLLRHPRCHSFARRLRRILVGDRQIEGVTRAR